jgi:hypothetical protein
MLDDPGATARIAAQGPSLTLSTTSLRLEGEHPETDVLTARGANTSRIIQGWPCSYRPRALRRVFFPGTFRPPCDWMLLGQCHQRRDPGLRLELERRHHGKVG